MRKEYLFVNLISPLILANITVMREKRRVLNFTNNIDSLVAAIAGAVFIFILTHYHGVGISPDSVSYSGTARNLCEGKWLVDFDENALIIFPAGYPVFLGSMSMLSKIDVLALAPFINALLVGIVIFIYGCIIERFYKSNRWYKLAILSIIPISYTILDVYTMLWSETFFMALLVFFLVFLRKYLSNPTLLNLMLPSIFTAIACDTRIAGISILGTGILLIVLQYQIPFLKKALHLALYGCTSMVLLVANLLHNQAETGTFTGIRQPSTTPLLTNIQYFGDTLLQWFQLPNLPDAISITIGITVILTLGIVFLIRFFWLEKQSAFETILLAFCLTYLFFILITSTISRYEKINNRLLSPAFIPLLLSISFYIPQLINKIKTKSLRIIPIGIVACLFLLLQYHQVKAARELQVQNKESGIPGYTEQEWQESDMVQFIKFKKDYFQSDKPIYSNANDAVYFYNPALSAQDLPEPAHTVDLKDYHEANPNYIIWFTNDFDNKSIMRLEEIAKFRQLDTLVKLDDGLILWSSPKK